MGFGPTEEPVRDLDHFIEQVFHEGAVVDHEEVITPGCTPFDEEDGLVEESVLYAGVKHTKDPSYVRGIVILIAKFDNGIWSFKGMGEESGPGYYRCPKRIIDQLSPLEEKDPDSDSLDMNYAEEWRQGCLEERDQQGFTIDFDWLERQRKKEEAKKKKALNIAILRKNAKALAKKQKIALHEAQDKIAIDLDYESWEDMIRFQNHTYFTGTWRNKFLTSEANSPEEMAELLRNAADQLEAMAKDGIEFGFLGAEDDHIDYSTDDPALAHKYHMEPDTEEYESFLSMDDEAKKKDLEDLTISIHGAFGQFVEEYADYLYDQETDTQSPALSFFLASLGTFDYLVEGRVSTSYPDGNIEADYVVRDGTLCFTNVTSYVFDTPHPSSILEALGTISLFGGTTYVKSKKNEVAGLERDPYDDCSSVAFSDQTVNDAEIPVDPKVLGPKLDKFVTELIDRLKEDNDQLED